MKAAEDQLTSRAGTQATPGRQHSMAGAARPGHGRPGGSAAVAARQRGRSALSLAAPGMPRCLPFTFASRLRSPPPTAAEPGTAVGPFALHRCRHLQRLGAFLLSQCPAAPGAQPVGHSPCPRGCRRPGPHTPRRGREAGGEMLPGVLAGVCGPCRRLVPAQVAVKGLRTGSSVSVQGLFAPAVGARKPGQKLSRSHYGVLHTPHPSWTFVSNT